MDKNKTSLIALSLSVIALSAITIFQSLNQSGVLGDTTTRPSARTSVAPAKVIEKPNPVCQEVRGLYHNYCLKTDSPDTGKELPPPIDENTEGGASTNTIGLVDTGSFCGDLFKLVGEFCPTVAPGPKPSPGCKYGVNSFQAGTSCKTSAKPTGSASNLMYELTSYTSAKYTCYDGTIGEVSSPNKSCLSHTALREMARKACQGHGTCTNPVKPTGKPSESKYCTGDAECNTGEHCLIPVPVRKNSANEVLAFGRCVKEGVRVTPRVTSRPRVTPKTSPGGRNITCDWCGTSCVVSRPGLKCPQISAPVGQSCDFTGTSCKATYLKD